MTEKNIIFVQPSAPAYRVDFYNRLDNKYGDRLIVYASTAKMGALDTDEYTFRWLEPLADTIDIGPALQWQPGVMNIPFDKNDLIIVSGGPRCITNMLLLLKAKLKGAKTIWWGHYRSSSSRDWRVKLRMFFSRYSDAILFYTTDEVDAYRASGMGKESQPLGALENGIDHEPIKAMRKPYDSTKREKNLFYIGRFTEKAKMRLLLKAMRDKRLADVRCHIVGGGDEEASLKQLSEDYGIADQMIWHGGTADEDEISKVANECIAFVYPGEVGLSIVHAMAYGLPSIVHDDVSKHMPEIAAFKDGHTGQSFKLDSESDLADTIYDMVSNKDRLNTYSLNCLELMGRNFSTEGMARNFEDFVNEHFINKTL